MTGSRRCPGQPLGRRRVPEPPWSSLGPLHEAEAAPAQGAHGPTRAVGDSHTGPHSETCSPAPPPQWTGCSLSAPAWGPCARGLCRGPGPGRSTFHLAVPSKASHRLRAHHTPAGLSGCRQMASRVPGAGGPQPRPRGGPASEAPSASAAATSAPPPPQVLVSGDPRCLAPQRVGAAALRAWTASHMSPWCSYALPPPSAAGPPPLSGLRGRILP